LLLPQFYRWLLKRKDDAGAANLALARVSVLFLALGALGMGLATAAPIVIICRFTSVAFDCYIP
jgi:hypothetical protein